MVREDLTDTKMCYRARLINGLGRGINRKIRGIEKNPEIDAWTHGSETSDKWVFNQRGKDGPLNKVHRDNMISIKNTKL